MLDKEQQLIYGASLVPGFTSETVVDGEELVGFTLTNGAVAVLCEFGSGVLTVEGAQDSQAARSAVLRAINFANVGPINLEQKARN